MARHLTLLAVVLMPGLALMTLLAVVLYARLALMTLLAVVLMPGLALGVMGLLAVVRLALRCRRLGRLLHVRFLSGPSSPKTNRLTGGTNQPHSPSNIKHIKTRLSHTRSSHWLNSPVGRLRSFPSPATNSL